MKSKRRGSFPILTDTEIIDLYWQRNEKAIEATDNKYGKYLYGIAYNIVRDGFECEECLDDTYLGTWNRIPPARPSAFQAFLSRITRNIAIDKFRKKRAEKRIPSELMESLDEIRECFDAENAPERQMEIKEIALILSDFLRNLPKRRSLIFICRYYYADKVSDIAKMLEVSESTVWRELSEIRRELKITLVKEGVLYE